MNHHIGVIGGGNMAQAIITGLLKSGCAASDILVSDPNPESRKAISALGVAAFDHHEPVMAQAECMILAAKPQMMDVVLAEIAPSLSESQIVISIAAGITIGGIRRRLNAPKNTVVRVMPNTPALCYLLLATYYLLLAPCYSLLANTSTYHLSLTTSTGSSSSSR